MFVNRIDVVWNNMLIEARLLIYTDPVLKNFIYEVFLQYSSFEEALVNLLSKKLTSLDLNTVDLINLLKDIYKTDPDIVISAAQDIFAIRSRDPSVNKYITPFLYCKGFHALQAYRIFHWLWLHDRLELAMYFCNHISVFLNVDIHPAAKIGCGVMLDHATGVVIGETAIIGNNVSIMQSVTLGSTGKVCNDGDRRHPKIDSEVLIGAGAIVLGNINIGCGSKIGAGSVVLHSVPPYSTVTGSPARLVH